MNIFSWIGTETPINDFFFFSSIIVAWFIGFFLLTGVVLTGLRFLFVALMGSKAKGVDLSYKKFVLKQGVLFVPAYSVVYVVFNRTALYQSLGGEIVYLLSLMTFMLMFHIMTTARKV